MLRNKHALLIDLRGVQEVYQQEVLQEGERELVEILLVSGLLDGGDLRIHLPDLPDRLLQGILQEPGLQGYQQASQESCQHFQDLVIFLINVN